MSHDVRRLVQALLMLAALAGCAKQGAESQDAAAADPVVSVRLATVVERRFGDVVTGSGQWRSGGDVILSAPFACVVETLGVRVGDPVEAGAHVGVLATRESWAGLRGAELLAREARDAQSRTEADAALQLARRELVRVPIVAPQSGVVIRRAAEPGAQVAESAEILALSPWGSEVFEAHVPVADVAAVRAGQAARVHETGGEARDATVERVLPMASGADQSALVWLKPRPGARPPGLDRFGEVEILVGASRNSLAVPDSAIVEDDLTGQRRVAVVDSTGRIAWVPVTLGAAAGGWHELRSGSVARGARVVIEGQHGVPAGTRVAPRP